MITWKRDQGRAGQLNKSQETADHPLNMIHKLDLIPASYRGNLFKKQLAFLYLQTRLQLNQIEEADFASILDVAALSIPIKCATYLKLITHKGVLDYRAIYVITKLLDIIVGFEPELDFTGETVEAIKTMETGLLYWLRIRLPSIGMDTVKRFKKTRRQLDLDF